MDHDGCTHPTFRSVPREELVLLAFDEHSFGKACERIVRQRIPNCPGGGRNAFVIPRRRVRCFRSLDFKRVNLSQSRCGEC